jgi:hypothetical protein
MGSRQISNGCARRLMHRDECIAGSGRRRRQRLAQPARRDAIELLEIRMRCELMNSGELLETYRKWFDTDRLRMPMNAYMKENLRFPNKYGVP